MVYDRYPAIDENNEFPPEVEAVNRTGDSMSGPLLVDDTPSLDLQVVPKQYVDAKVVDASFGSQTDAAMSVAAAKAYLPTAALPRTGGTITGNLLVEKASPIVMLNTIGVDTKYFLYRVTGVNRWSLGVSNTPETGGNTGSNFGIYRYDDSGAFIDLPLGFDRATGRVQLSSAAAAAATTSISVVPKSYVDNQLTTAKAYTDLAQAAANAYTDDQRNVAKAYTDSQIDAAHTHGVTSNKTLAAGADSEYTFSHHLGATPSMCQVSVTGETGKPSILANIKSWNGTSITVSAANQNNSVGETFAFSWLAMR